MRRIRQFVVPALRASRSFTFVILVAATGVLGQPRHAAAANPALMRLLQVLRDKGSISAQEYDDIRAVADAPDAPAAPPPPAASASASAAVVLPAQDSAQDVAIAELKAATTGTPAPVVARALAGKWYERVAFRGYSQLRYSSVGGGSGAGLEIPADRSVNPAESFVLRRGRMVFSGDVAKHLSIYAQTDLAASTGATDLSVQARDLYGDVWFDQAKTYRVRLGLQKVIYGWSNMQSSSNRAPFERPDAINSGVEGERDLGATAMWTSTVAKQRFHDITALGLKGTGDYGVAAVGLYSGQGPNRSDTNGDPHVVARLTYPFKLEGGQFIELGVQGFHGHFVSPTGAVTAGGATFTPAQRSGGGLDQRVAVTAIVYPQPFGVEAEWTVGRGPELSGDGRSIATHALQGGYVQLNFKPQSAKAWFPFTRWNYFDGARKFARNAPRDDVNEIDAGVEFAKWAEVEVTGMFTHTFRRTHSSTFPVGLTRHANRVGFQVQWNY